jgi:hypothetical protein
MDNAAQRLESCIDPVYHPVRGKDAKTLNLTPRLHKIRDTLQAHAAVVRDLINQYSDSKDPSYCVRVTANEGALGDQYLSANS